MESSDNGPGEMQMQRQRQSMELVSQLSLIHQLLLQLKQSQFIQPPCSTCTCTSSLQLSDAILSQLLSATENTVRLAKSCLVGPVTGEPASPPRSASASPRSDMSDLAFKSCQDESGNRREGGGQVCKKRKTLPRWHSQVRMGCMGGVEGPLDDGHSWRKYGQKDILGAKHPRGYYRCTYRNSQGCPATKQVQRTDGDPTVFDVVYQGTHTCTSKSDSRSGPNVIRNNNSSSSNNINNNNIIRNIDNNSNNRRRSQDDDYLSSLKATLTVKTEGLGPSGTAQEEAEACNSMSFSFPSTSAPIQDCRLASKPDDYYFPSASTLLPSFANSPATSESNYFSVSPCGVGGQGFRKVDSDLTEVISVLSAAASTTTSTSPSPSPVGAVDFAFEGLDFEIDPCSFEFLS